MINIKGHKFKYDFMNNVYIIKYLNGDKWENIASCSKEKHINTEIFYFMYKEKLINIFID